MTSTTTPPPVNMQAFRPLAEACYEAVQALDKAIHNAGKHQREHNAAREEVSGHLAVINALREQIRLKFPGAPGVVGSRAWSHPKDYSAHGNKYTPIEGDIRLGEPEATAEPAATSQLPLDKNEKAALARILGDMEASTLTQQERNAIGRVRTMLTNDGPSLQFVGFDLGVEAVAELKRADGHIVATPPEHQLYSEKASEVRTLLSKLYDRVINKKNGSLVPISFGTLCDVMNLLEPGTTATGSLVAAARTLIGMGWSHEGGEQWRPPFGKSPLFAKLVPTVEDIVSGIKRRIDTIEAKGEGAQALSELSDAINEALTHAGSDPLSEPHEVALTVGDAVEALKLALRNDLDYAWTWHCNIAMPIMDSSSLGHRLSNVSAAHLMRHLFDVDITKHTHYVDLMSRLDAEEAKSVTILHASQFESIKQELARGWPLDPLADKIVRMKDGPADLYRYIGRNDDSAPELAQVEDSEGRIVGIRYDLLEAVPASEGGYPDYPEPEGTAEDLRPLIEYPARRLTLTFTHPTIGEGVFTSEVLKAMGPFLMHMSACELPTDPYNAPAEPRYPFTAPNGVVVDVLAWKTVDDLDGQPATPPDMDAMLDSIRTAALSVSMSGLRGPGETTSICTVPSGTVIDWRSDMLDASPKPPSTRTEPDETIYVTAASDIKGGDSMRVNVTTGLAWPASGEKAPAPETQAEPSGNRRVFVAGDIVRSKHKAAARLVEVVRVEEGGVDVWTRYCDGSEIPFLVHADNIELATMAEAVKGVDQMNAAEATPEPMKPTIGRRVWFRPDPRTGSSGFIVIDHSQPLDAGIAWVWSDHSVNLDVTDHQGNHHAILSVELLQPGQEPPTDRSYAEWMPFQIKTAGKQ